MDRQLAPRDGDASSMEIFKRRYQWCRQTIMANGLNAQRATLQNALRALTV